MPGRTCVPCEASAVKSLDMDNMNFADFTSVAFPQDEEIVYVLCFKRQGETVEKPFYVGESRRGARRFGDYITAQFAAPTDFKVGVVVQTLQSEGAEVIVKYQRSVNRRSDEARLIQEARKYHPLLNDQRNYDHKINTPVERNIQMERFKALAQTWMKRAA